MVSVQIFDNQYVVTKLAYRLPVPENGPANETVPSTDEDTLKTLNTMLAVALAAGVVTTVEAQTASVNATARVLVPIIVVTTEDLRFGDVIQGVNKVVDADDATSAQFEFRGSTGAEIDIVLTLPTDLDDGGGILMPINTWTGRRGVNATRGVGTVFTPVNAASIIDNFGAAGGDWYRIFLGATVVPGVAQTTGNYTGQIALLVSYTGN